MTHHRRRYYTTGRLCQDCGNVRPRTLIRFWATGMRYVVCGDCIRPYRHVIVGYVPGDRP